MNDFYEETPKLNIKKVAIIIIIFIILLAFIIVFIAKKISTPKNNTSSVVTETSTIYYSNDKSISIELSNNLNLNTYDSGLNYLLELRSPNNLNIFVSKQDVIQNKDFMKVVNADKLAFLNNFEGYSNLSEIKELSVNNNIAYTYSFHYLDKVLNTAFYLQVIWLQIDNEYYIFDIEFPLNDLSFNTNIVSSVLSTFKLNK